MSLPRYPKYKDSREDWFGEVPEHWEVKPNKAFLSLCRSEVGHTSAEKTLLSLTLKGVIPRDLESGKGKFPADFAAYQDVSKDDLVFCLFDIDETPRTVGLAQESGMITGAYDVLRCKGNVLPQFVVNYYLNIDSFKGLKPFYTGLRKVVRLPTFMSIKVPLPPLKEQTQIATFLDRETSKIDALVAEQRRLIALLKEKRQAVISHTVTQGLNPHAPMKPSGIEWLGEVPEHWDVCSLRRIVTAIEQGWSPECFSRPAEDEEWGVLKAGCVNRGTYDQNDNKALPAELAPMPEYEVQVGDVLMSRASGSPELVGSTALVTSTREKLMLSDKIFRLRFDQRMEPSFFVAALNSRPLRSQIEQALSGGNGLANNLPQASLRGFFLAVPPLLEQSEICDHIESELANFYTLTTEAQRAIDLLQERRTALISSAVTGQIDVRAVLQ